jgi:gluconolactonase
VSAGNRWERVSAAGIGTAEGVAADRDGAIYVTDLTYAEPSNPGGTVYRYDPATGETSKFMEPAMVNGVKIAPNGDLLLAEAANGGGRAIVRRDIATGQSTVLAAGYQGKRFVAPNDLCLDSRGRIYFTDARYRSKDEPELPNACYRLDPDGRLTQLDTGVLRPNGIDLSPDEKHLYVAASMLPTLLPNPRGPAADRYGFTFGGVAVFDRAEDGGIANGRVFWRNGLGLADGMAMDTEGNLYVAVSSLAGYNQIAVLSPSGQLIEALPLPPEGGAVTLGFGRGADARTLYLATRRPWGLWRLKTAKTGFNRF